MSDFTVWLVCYSGQKYAYEYTCRTHDEAVKTMEELKILWPWATGWHVVEKDVS